MKKSAFYFLLIGFLTFIPFANAQTESAEAPAAETPEALAPAAEEEVAAENLEFVSGEVTSSDGTAKTIAVKLYGETETSGDKSLTIQVADTTDITDGEKDRDFASLAPGTEVDVEYDPATAKATYIFIY
jgi:hypothetical protein